MQGFISPHALYLWILLGFLKLFILWAKHYTVACPLFLLERVPKEQREPWVVY